MTKRGEVDMKVNLPTKTIRQFNVLSLHIMLMIFSSRLTEVVSET